MVYYNEFDPFAAAWLRALIDSGELPAGDVDERSIEEVQADELRGYSQCHFFAGIGGWPLALRWAGVAPDEPLWTGSCPCQPFSAAGKRKGKQDARHLWPVFGRLIANGRPPVVFGEQVASKDGRLWLAGVRADLAKLGYATPAADLCAAGIGTPHIRQRLYWVADAGQSPPRRDSERRRLDATCRGEQGFGSGQATIQPARCCEARGVADSECGAPERQRQHLGGPPAGTEGEARKREWIRSDSGTGCDPLRLGDTGSQRLEGHAGDGVRVDEPGRVEADSFGSAPPPGLWTDARLTPCRDRRFRRIEPSAFPLAHGIPRDMGRVRTILEGMGHDPKSVRRMLGRARSVLAVAGRNRAGRLKGYGNAIVPQLAVEFIQAYREAVDLVPRS